LRLSYYQPVCFARRFHKFHSLNESSADAVSRVENYCYRRAMAEAEVGRSVMTGPPPTRGVVQQAGKNMREFHKPFVRFIRACDPTDLQL
jgi:hypothetical protein